MHIYARNYAQFLCQMRGLTARFVCGLNIEIPEPDKKKHFVAGYGLREEVVQDICKIGEIEKKEA